MAYDPGAIDATLTAAVGDDPALIAELRQAFLDSVKRAADALEVATSGDDWRSAAWRLKGLAASFGAVRLMALAVEAGQTAPGDESIIHRLRRAVDRL
jgi:HPt (histidine-containing phosphotransfer) domain-containing protein